MLSSCNGCKCLWRNIWRWESTKKRLCAAWVVVRMSTALEHLTLAEWYRQMDEWNKERWTVKSTTISTQYAQSVISTLSLKLQCVKSSLLDVSRMPPPVRMHYLVVSSMYTSSVNAGWEVYLLRKRLYNFVEGVRYRSMSLRSSPLSNDSNAEMSCWEHVEVFCQ